MRGCRKSGVALPASTAASNDESLPGRREVKQLFAGIGVIHHSADGHRQFDGTSVATRPVASFSMTAALRLVLRVESEVKQSVVMLAGRKNHVAAAPAVAAARTAPGDKLLAPERKTPVAAAAGFDLDINFVDEHGLNGKLTNYLQCRREGGLNAKRAARLPSLALLRGCEQGLALCENVDVLAEPASVAELDRTSHFCEQRVVFAEANVLAGLIPGATLTHDDGSAAYKLPREYFDTKPLGIRIATVF
jgi:hypothetical protein